MHNFEIIVPVVNVKMFCTYLFNSICNNILLPKKIIIINNSKYKNNNIFKHKMLKYIVDNTLNIEIYSSETGFVNESFNIGISHLSSNCDYVSFLNEDVILNDCFFQKNLKVFEIKNCGVACPKTVNFIKNLINDVDNIQQMSKREGWAFTVRKDLLDLIPPIPHKKLSIFFGDDWFWYHSIDAGFLWYKNTGNVIYHKVGVSKNTKFKPILNAERKEFQRIVKKYNWIIKK